MTDFGLGDNALNEKTMLKTLQHHGLLNCTTEGATQTDRVGELHSDDRVVADRNPNVMVKVEGSSFRCECGCNVFHHGERDDIYICNACEARYIGE